MTLWRPDASFYPSPTLAAQAERERLGYVATLNVHNGRPDALSVVDLDPGSPDYGRIVHVLNLPYLGDELHHFGWNACSSALCPYAPHPHLERRYLIVPGLRSSRIYVIDTKPNPRNPEIVKVIEPEAVIQRSGYSRPHTVHCGPDAVYLSALGGRDGQGPGGLFTLDHFSFEVLGPWEIQRGPQELAYDFWWHLGHDVAVTSEWGTPDLYEDGLRLEDVLARRFGRRLHFWDLRRRRHLQAVELGEDAQMVLELRPAHDPTKTYGFVGVVLHVGDLSSSIWAWHLDQGSWQARKIISIPAEPADPDALPPALKDLKAVPPLVTDIALSLDDRFLYVSCWGTGELRQYDVADPFQPRHTATVALGGIVRRAAHPAAGPLLGGPQMVEVSRDGRRVYLTNSLYSRWDDQFYPGLKGWLAKLDADPAGGLALDPRFFVDFGDSRPHQIRLQGGDASSDSFCYP
ncbi:selenium-binding protein SBP56-related protein [Candidatus Methylocalor cossyra]|uniref:Methanethiol oxidase n=1 Tax=Candidatus Methylocalor cossyra TaxID=3108543 RepID=A0ABM9NIC4_9GAMM